MLVYGGGRAGSMGALADGALARGGRVVGIIPRFMRELEWGHEDISELLEVEDMRTRKHEMLSRSSAVVALAGGCGTFEELMEAGWHGRREAQRAPGVHPRPARRLLPPRPAPAPPEAAISRPMQPDTDMMRGETAPDGGETNV